MCADGRTVRLRLLPADCLRFAAPNSNNSAIKPARILIYDLDHLRRARIVLQFAAKAENLHVNAPIEHVFVDSGCLQKMLSAKRPLGSVEEGDKQRVFAFGQRNVRAIRIGKPSGAKIELPAGKPIAAAFWLSCR